MKFTPIVLAPVAILTVASCEALPPAAESAPQLADAEFHILDPEGAEPVAIRFDVTSFAHSAANEFKENVIPGGASVLQFLRAHGDRLSLTLHFDTSETAADVREETAQVLALMDVVPAVHAPPIVQFRWRSFEFRCVLEEALERVDEIDADGRPVRARLELLLREHEPFNP